MFCKKSTAKKYRNRPSPPYPAGSCPGKRKTGSDGWIYVSEADKHGVYRWKRASTRKKRPRNSAGKMTKKEKADALEASRRMPPGEKKGRGVKGDSPGDRVQTVYVEDNGIRPFKVEIDKGVVRVYPILYNKDADKTEYQEKTVYEGPFQHIWLGDNYLKLRFYDPPGAKGNSILLRTGKSQYVYIGHIIFSFDTGSDEIVEYYSPIGNSDVPYPYAMGKEYAYFMLDEKKVPVDQLDAEKDGYQQFYLEVPDASKKKFRTRRIAGRQF